MTAADLARANELKAQIEEIAGIIDAVEDPETELLYQPKSEFRVDASDFPECVIGPIREAALKALREHRASLDAEFEQL